MTVKMIACCPACSTLFKVEPEQLRVASGWVRCGQCMAVFDARARMLPADSYESPDDLPWSQGAGGVSDAAPPSDWAGGAATAAPQPQAAAPRSADAAAAEDGALVPPPEREPPAAESPAFTSPGFELVPPFAPEELTPEPGFIGAPPVSADALRTTAAPVQSVPIAEPAVPAPTPPFPMLADDELDRRYAKLLETLARLRQDAEKQRKRELKAADTGLPGEDALGSSARDEQDSPQPDVGRRAAPDDEMPAPGRGLNREDGQREKNRPAKRDSDDWYNSEFDDASLSRPVMDFALSEIGQSMPLPAAALQRPVRAPLRPEPPVVQTDPAVPSSLVEQARQLDKRNIGNNANLVPSFVEQARRRAFWGKPWVRVGLWVAAGVFSLALAVQIAVSLRDRLAAQHPGIKPLLLALCRPAQCRIAPWRHLNAVTIDSSAFVRTGPNGFGFAITLRNNGAAPVATPALELALIDAQEQPLARRVLDPADWGAPPQLAAHAEFNGAAQLTVGRAANPQAISNYRLTAFYP